MGFANPSNPCEFCDTAASVTSWSSKDGAACDDGAFCTVNDTCSGGACAGTARVCADEIACNGVEACDEAGDACAPGAPTCDTNEICDLSQDECIAVCTGCVVSNLCYGDGQVDPANPCSVCDPAASTISWTNNDGAACDDAVFCNGTDTCASGTCSVNSGDPCADDGIFCNGTEVCNEDTDSCESSGDPCTGEDICFEDRDECCIPNVAVSDLACNADGDAVATDSCNDLFVVDDCADVNGTCTNGVCGCAGNYSGEACDGCAPGWTGGACDKCFVYVNGAVGDDGNSGWTWDEALATVQAGIENSAPNGCEVWVAAGTYLPGVSRGSTFQLVPGVAVYGGFAGTELLRGERDIALHATILSGDLNGDDGFDFANNDENAYHVVTGADNATLDGFTITAGNANVPPDNLGGGMVNSSVSPTVSNCTFESNWAQIGAGMHNRFSSPAVTHCTFSHNSASHVGGGMCNQLLSSPALTNCTFSHNSAGDTGGGIHNQFSSSPIVVSCTFELNSANRGGGMDNDYSSPTVTNCSFSQNSAVNRGGGMSNLDSPVTLINCILWGNTALEGPQIYYAPDAPTITYSDVQGGHTGAGNIDADPQFVDAAGGELQLNAGSPCIDAGDSVALPVDSTDLDGDGDTTEPIPFDLAGGERVVGASVDMGAYEF
jgi:hypothetical protein